jgi:hypothetical protein
MGRNSFLTYPKTFVQSIRHKGDLFAQAVPSLYIVLVEGTKEKDFQVRNLESPSILNFELCQNLIIPVTNIKAMITCIAINNQKYP